MAAFKILSLSLTFCILIVLCLAVGLFGFLLLGTILYFLDLYIYFLLQVKEVFFHELLKIGFNFLLSLSPPSGTPMMWMLVCSKMFQRLIAPSSLFWIFFSFCCFDWVFSFFFGFLIFQITVLILCFIYCTVDSL